MVLRAVHAAPAACEFVQALPVCIAVRCPQVVGVDVNRCVYSVLVAGDREPIRGVPREDIRRPLKRGALAPLLGDTKAAVTVTRE